VISKTIVNETRFQFEHSNSLQNADNSTPTIDVQEAFTGGGSQIGQSHSDNNEAELTNNTSFAMGQHSLKVGGRLRWAKDSSFSPQNFGGTFSFFGTGGGLTSIERFQRTIVLQEQGATPAQIRAAGGGASQFRLSSGNPESEVSQWDFGGYFQDDWKVRPNLTLSLGLRYENQSNIDSNFNFAPRIGFAWQPGGTQSKTVLRGGYGIFYERVSENLTMTSERL